MNSEQRRNSRKALLQLYGAVCFWCKQVTPPDELTLDHIRAKSRGGRNHRRNLCLSCQPCNQAKGSMEPHEFVTWLELNKGLKTPLNHLQQLETLENRE